MSIIQQNISLRKYNTFGIDAKAKLFAQVHTEQELVEVFDQPESKTEQLLILGGGSNMLFVNDFDGLVIKMDIKGISQQVTQQSVFLTAGGGEVWNDLVKYSLDQGFTGLENLTLIPGTVGASPIQNIGAYGVELKDVFDHCRAFEIATGTFKTFNFDDCGFGYRESVFKGELKGQYIITEVTFRLATEANLKTHYGAINAELSNRGIDAPTAKDVSDVVAAIRVSKLPDPTTIGNAGSFFKNPVVSISLFEKLQKQYPDIPNYPAPNNQIKLAAGWLIEQCGFKGKVEGQTGTWKNQALVLVNHGNATGAEVYSFSETIIQSVANKFAVNLEREVNVLS